MRSTILPALALVSSTVAEAGYVVMYMCQSGGQITWKSGTADASVVSYRVHYNNESDGCKDNFASDAQTGTVPGVLGFKKFCGDDGFCGNIDMFPEPGAHIELDGKDVALGKPDTSYEYGGKTAVTICNR